MESFSRPTSLPPVAPSSAPPPVAQEPVRDLLFPAREMAKMAQEAEKQRKWEEEQAQYLKLKQLRESGFQSGLPLPKPSNNMGSNTSFPPMPHPSQNQAQPQFGEQGFATPPSSLSFQQSSQPQSHQSSFQQNPGNPDFSQTFSTLLSTDNPQQPSSTSSTFFPGGSYPSNAIPGGYSSNSVPQAYQDQPNQGGNSPQPPASNMLTMEEQFKRLSSVQDFNAPPQGDTGANGSPYGNMSSQLPPSYSTALQDETYQSDMEQRIKRLSSVQDFGQYQNQGNSPSSQGNSPSFQGNSPSSFEDAQRNSPHQGQGQSNRDGGPSQDSNALYQDFDFGVEKNGSLVSSGSNSDWGASSDHPNRDMNMYYGERMAYSRNAKMKKKAAKFLIPLATTGTGVVAGALGGAAIGAAVSGGVAAPVGMVIGAVVGGSAGCSVGLAATNNKKFDDSIQVSSKRRYTSARCGSCQIGLDAIAGQPFACPSCRRLFCSNCSHTTGSSENQYCQFCIRSIETPNYRRLEYRR